MRGGDLSARVHVEEGGHRVSLSDGDFPVPIGGEGSPVPVAGSGFPLAWLGLSQGDVFVQPAPGVTVHCNGARLAASHWLRDGDVLRIGATQVDVAIHADGAHLRVEPLGDANPTEPPVVLVPPPRPEHAREPGASTGPAITPVAFKARPIGTVSSPRRTVQPMTVLAAGSLALGGLVLYLLATSRAVVVEIVPEPDRLALRGSLPALPLGSRFLARPGRYAVVAEKEGYRRLEQNVEVTEAAQPPFRFMLVPLPGRLAVDTGEVRGAEVFVDGKAVGATPVAGAEAEAGEREVAVRAEGYLEFRTRVAIEGRGIAQRMDVSLVANSAPVGFDSVPPGATVRVDGRALGTTPLTTPVSAGERTVELTLAGYVSQSRRVEVVAGRPATLPVFRLSPADGVLALESDPPGAAVSVDGAWKGETPVEVALAPGRPHEVRVAKAAHEDATLRLTLRNGERREEAVRLAPLTGEVVVAARPPDAELLVDGQPRGKADQTLKLAAVPHEIEIRREGYEAFKQTVTPRPGFPQSVRVALKSAQEAREERAPRVVRSPEGHELVRIDGGRIQMGASRREPGRRANEAPRDVELVRPFYVATREVSNLQFRRFEPGHSSGSVGAQSLDIDDYPVVRVSWQQAAAFCNWMSEREKLPLAYVQKENRLAPAAPPTIGYRLPTEAEWEKVARYPAGASAVKYPWGPALPIPPKFGNYADVSARALLGQVLGDYDDGYPATAPVASFAPNALGLFHLGDNVAEWAHDFYTITPSSPGELARDPTGPADGEYHVIRGASWMHSTVTELRLSFRDYGKDPRPDVGFRVARYTE